jgi:hypothetical protein
LQEKLCDSGCSVLFLCVKVNEKKKFLLAPHPTESSEKKEEKTLTQKAGEATR